VFGNVGEIKFETVHQAVNGDVVIAEQIHGLGLPQRNVAPVMNMAIYEIRDGTIVAWRDYRSTGDVPGRVPVIASLLCPEVDDRPGFRRGRRR
jgi:limonene-1,2-epoxide hydrolase